VQPTVHTIVDDELGKSIVSASASLAAFRSSSSSSSSSDTWDSFIRQNRGPSNASPGLKNLPHPARRLLQHLSRNGAPVVLTTSPWDHARCDAAMERGSHASTAEHNVFLRVEMGDMVSKGFWIVLPYSQVRSIPGLRISPMGVVPQRDRRPRTIVDYTFSDVNAETARLAPREAMQFGHALHRILRQIRFADPAQGPVYMLKVDISDGFYRVYVAPRDVPKLGVAFPAGPDGEPLVAFPLALPMGWTESPPYFTAFTETVVDVAKGRLSKGSDPPPHRLEPTASTLPPPPELPRPAFHEGNHRTGVPPTLGDSVPSITVPPTQSRASACSPDDRCRPSAAPLLVTAPTRRPPGSRPARAHRRQPLSYYDVFVDDAVACAQGSKGRLGRVRRILLYALDDVFRPLEASDPSNRQEPASVKKMLKGDACWSTLKTVLGWLIDTLRGTIELPPHRLERLQELFDLFRGKRRVALKSWYQLLGELRSMTLAIPGGTGMFTQLQLALRVADKSRVKLTQAVHDSLQDFEYLTTSLGERPVRIAEVVPTQPTHVGASDAARAGMGGVWVPGPDDGNASPLLWREAFPADIQAALVTFRNPNGSITNSDLELAGVLCHQDILAHIANCRELTLATLCDNSPAVAWVRRASISTNSSAAYLLRLLALHRRHYRYLTEVSHIPGVLNSMADDASRLWHLSDTDLLTHFNSTYPQRTSWVLCPLRPKMSSAVTSALRKKRPDPASFLAAAPAPGASGMYGWDSAGASTRTPSSPVLPTRSSSYRSLHTASVKANLPVTPAATRSELELWRTISAQSVRGSPAWGPLTPGTN
jgi:hypothetical protein